MSIEKIKQRKDELNSKIDQIETKYSNKASDISGKIEKTLKPIRNIRNRPFTSLGISITVGFLVGIAGRKKKNKTHPSHGNSGVGFTSLFLSELKRMAAQRAMIYMSELVDQQVMPRFTGKKSNKEKKDHQA